MANMVYSVLNTIRTIICSTSVDIMIGNYKKALCLILGVPTCSDLESANK